MDQITTYVGLDAHKNTIVANIGHSIISRAVLTGLDKAVRDMLELIRLAR